VLRPLLLVCTISVRLAAQTALTPFQEQKARALLRTQLPCLGCHQLDDDGGRIAPPLTDVARRRSAAYIRAIVEEPARVVGAAMPKTRMPASTRELVIRLLSRGAAAGAPPVAPASSSAGPSAPALYATWCSGCHGPKGQGDGPNARYLPVRPAVHASAATMRERSDDALFDAIAGGGAVMGKSARMPAFGASLSADQIRGIVAYIRTLCTCTGPPWSQRGGI
jgi:mono/diheme cytochrome c family protein